MLVSRSQGLFCYLVPKGYAVIPARAIKLKWTYMERFIGVPMGYYLNKETQQF